MIPETAMELMTFFGTLGAAAAGSYAIWRYWVRPTARALTKFFDDVSGLRQILEEDVVERLRAGEIAINEMTRASSERYDKLLAGIDDIEKKLVTHVAEFDAMRDELYPKP